MKKILILSVALLAAIGCSDKVTTPEVEVVIETLEGSQFSLSEFGAYRFPSVDSWVIEDQSATTDDFEPLSAALEYISNNYPERQISIEFSSLESIPSYAIFGTTLSLSTRNFGALTSVSAPNATTIGINAFEYCYNMESISIPQVTAIDGYALRGCSSLTSLDLPLVTSLGYAVFSDCVALSSINIPLVDIIGEQAFRLCISLSEIDLPVATSLSYGAFAYCTALTSFNAPELITIGDYAFCEATNLSQINIPAVTQIGNYAFIACASFDSFTLTSSVEEVGDGIFNDCSLMTQIDVESDRFIFEDGILYNADKSEIIIALSSVISGDITLLDSVTSLRERAFYNCTEITSVNLPSVIVVSASAFANCSSITEATLPVATTLEREAFTNCVDMVTFTAPYATTLYNYSLCNCENLVTIALATASDATFEYVEEHAFYSTVISSAILTVGLSNADMVSYNDTLTVGNFEGEFDEVIVLSE